MTSRAYPKIRSRRVSDGQWVFLNGREAETLMGLQAKVAVGLRAYDFAGGPPFRLGAYILDLRGFGFPIRTDRENHEGGTHAVYVLECDVEIELVALRPPGEARAA